MFSFVKDFLFGVGEEEKEGLAKEGKEPLPMCAEERVLVQLEQVWRKEFLGKPRLPKIISSERLKLVRFLSKGGEGNVSHCMLLGDENDGVPEDVAVKELFDIVEAQKF